MSYFIFEANKQVFLNGEGNVSKICHSNDCSISADESKLVILKSSLVKVDTSRSSLNLNGGTSVNITGDQNAIHGVDFSDFLMHGSDNTVSSRQTKDSVWSGSQGQCQLATGENFLVYGNENQIIGQLNSNVLICGNANVIVINQTQHSKVRGHKNQVMVTRVNGLIVDGDDHRVYVSDINTRHILTKSPPVADTGFSFSPIAENRIDFCGIPTDCSIYTAILQTSMTPYEIGLKDEAGTKCVCNKYLQRKNCNGPLKLMPQLRIRYADQAYINNFCYILGIFKLYILDLSNLHYRHSPIQVKIIADELDPGSYRYRILPCGKIAMFFGNKNGVNQTLRLTGNHITENNDISFRIYFAEIE